MTTTMKPTFKVLEALVDRAFAYNPIDLWGVFENNPSLELAFIENGKGKKKLVAWELGEYRPSPLDVFPGDCSADAEQVDGVEDLEIARFETMYKASKYHLSPEWLLYEFAENMKDDCVEAAVGYLQAAAEQGHQSAITLLEIMKKI